ncbi:ABC transporter permease [Pseudoalteromonas piscicida]|uniref:ABC transporter permease n=1 Tax=Pseudoalteromonas piscicida TaxID=43662 RepID=UPI0030B16C7E
MFFHYLKIFFRTQVHQPLFSILKLLGFVIGLCGFILLYAVIDYERSYDTGFKNSDRIARVVKISDIESGKESSGLPYPLADAIKTDFQQVVESVRVQPLRGMLKKETIRFNELLLFVEPAFLTLFDLTYIHGNADSLSKPFSVILSERKAKKYFGHTDVIGETFQLGEDRLLTVTGVFKQWPKNSHLSAEVLIPFDSFLQLAEANIKDLSKITLWDNCHCYTTYLLLDKPSSFDQVNAGLKDLLIKHQGQEYAESIPIYLQHLTDVYLESDNVRTYVNHAQKGDGSLLMVFIAIAIVLLAISCINFTNLAVAQYTKQTKQLAVRKVLGASSVSIGWQYMIETLLISIIALVLSLSLSAMMLPWLAEFVDKPLSSSHIFGFEFVLQIIAVTFIAAAIAGAYPALVMSRFQASNLLREGDVSGASTLSAGNVRKFLVLLQFTISTVLVIAVIGVRFQVDHLQSQPRGFDIGNKLIVNGEGGDALQLQTRFAAIPGVDSVTISTLAPSKQIKNFSQIKRLGQDDADAAFVAVNNVSFGFMDTYQIKLLAGRSFNKDFGADHYTYEKADSGSRFNVLINHSALLKFGFKTPQSAIGEVLKYQDSSGYTETMQIVGVTNDVKYGSPKEAVDPMLYVARSQWQELRKVTYLTIDSMVGNADGVLNEVESIFNSMVPGFVLDADWLNEAIAIQTSGEEKQFSAIALFSLASISVSLLGLVGLTAFSAEKRSKELAIRRVIGASKREVVRLLTLEQLKLIVLSTFVAWPVVYYVLKDWLQQFHSKVDMSASWFALGTLLVCLISYAIVAVYSLRIAYQSPVENLRSE